MLLIPTFIPNVYLKSASIGWRYHGCFLISEILYLRSGSVVKILCKSYLAMGETDLGIVY